MQKAMRKKKKTVWAADKWMKKNPEFKHAVNTPFARRARGARQLGEATRFTLGGR
jgi:hypothetical protein